MRDPELSLHFKSRQPSDIRLAQIEFLKRKDNIKAINTAIGNVSLPVHPAIQKRMFALDSKESPFHKGVVKYTPSIGMPEANQAVLNIIASSGFKTDQLFSMITDGGSMAMELMIIGVCGPAGSSEKPLMLIDAAYTNYNAFAERVGRKTVSVCRVLQDDGKFTLPNIKEIENCIEKNKPGALVVIPYDNPTGQFYNRQTMIILAELCVKYNLWMISDEAYRELHYVAERTSSIWDLTDEVVPGIEGRRISIETSSKVWNGCGLRIGALVTDNKEFHERALAEYTTNLCANSIGQYIFGALAHESKGALSKWYEKQRGYYKPMMVRMKTELQKELPGIIVSSPDSALYSVVDVKNIATANFNSTNFVLYCAREGKVELNGTHYTLLVAPMSGFYSTKKGDKNPGNTQMRIAYVETPERMSLVPKLFAHLFKEFENKYQTKG